MAEHDRNQNSLRIDQQEKAFYFYSNNQHEIKEYLSDKLSETFDELDVEEFQKDITNITTRIIDQTSVVYREPAERNFVNNEEFVDKEGKLDEVRSKANEDMLNEKTKAFTDLLPIDINSVDKTAHRYAKLNNVSFTRVKWDGKIVYEVHPAWKFDVIWDDENPYKMLELSYLRYFMEGNTKVLYRIVWTDTGHWREKIVDINNRGARTREKLPVPGLKNNNEGMINPYGVIPFAVCRMKKTGDFWGNGADDVITANENINFMLTDLMNGNIMQTWGILKLTNTNYGKKAGKSKEGETNNAKKVRISAKHPIVIEGASTASDQLPPDAEFISATPNTEAYRDTIDWRIKLVASTRGLDPNSFLQDVKATSGYSKIIDSLAQLELRIDDIEPCREYEQDRFDKTKAVVNYYNGTEIKGGDSKKAIPDLELKVDFAEISIPKTAEELIKERDWKLEKLQISLVDVLREDNPDLNKEQAEARIIENKRLKEEFTPAPVIDVNPDNQNNNEDNNNNEELT